MSKTVTVTLWPLAAIWILVLSLGNIFHAISVSWWLVALPLWIVPAVALSIFSVIAVFFLLVLLVTVGAAFASIFLN